MDAFTSEGVLLIHSLGWTLLHSLWQGGIIAGGLWILLKLLPGIAARIRYHLLLSGLLLLIVWFVCSWIQQWHNLQPVTADMTESGKITGMHGYTITSIPASDGLGIWLYRLLPDMNRFFPWLVGIYLTGMCCMALRIASGLSSVLQLKNKHTVWPDAALVNLLHALLARLNMTREVKLLCSACINVPMMAGALKPVILLPLAGIARLSPAELEAILLHELAHIKRNDYLVNILQTCIETVLFFNPFMWWISAGIRREREYCCDDLVIAETRQPLPYARALATLEACRLFTQPQFAQAATGQKHHLFQRIKRITQMKNAPLSYGRLAASVSVITIITASVIWLTPVFAQHKKNKEAPKAAGVQRTTPVDEKSRQQEADRTNLSQTEAENLKDDDISGDEQQEAGRSVKKTVTVSSFSNSTNNDNEEQEEAGHPANKTVTVSTFSNTNEDDDEQAAIDEAMRIARAQIRMNRDEVKRAADEARTAAGLARAATQQALKDIDWKKIDRQMKEADRQIKEADRQMSAVNRKDVMRAIAMAQQTGNIYANNMVVVNKKGNKRIVVTTSNGTTTYSSDDTTGMMIPPIPPMPAMPPMPPLPSVPAMPPMPPSASRYNKMISEMHREGLINKNKGFKIVKKDGMLYIDGREQPVSVQLQYRHYFTGKTVKISGDSENLNVSEVN